MRRLIPIFLMLSAGCTGQIGDAESVPGVEDIETRPPQLGEDALASPVGLGYAPLRRLSAREAKLTLEQALGVTIEQRLFDTYWPLGESVGREDASPFDNDAMEQLGEAVYSPPESPLQNSLVEFSMRVVAAMSDSEVQALVPCSPASPDDAICFEEFLHDVGRLLLRHPLSQDHIDVYRDGLLAEAEAADDFYVGVRLALRALLLDMEFFYHLEGTVRTSAAHVMRLSEYELASRIAFLLWGRGPDAALLDRVAERGFSTPAGIRAQAVRMMTDSRALEQVARIHAMWLGYEQAYLGDDAELEADLRQESFKLVERVLFGAPRPWSDLFTEDETYVTPRLAMHYGMGPIAEEGWVAYADGRAGLLSHGTFLTVGTTAVDTSPSRRGNAVLRRLTCSEVVAPNNLQAIMNVTTDPGSCKSEWWNMVDNPECQGCHRQMDYIGFGLENYEALGVYRDREELNPSCAIEGDGYGSWQ